jgi:hypothetical protein
MPTFRVYALDMLGRISAPGIIVECASDLDLPEQLKMIEHPYVLDVWDGTRHVMSFDPRNAQGQDGAE